MEKEKIFEIFLKLKESWKINDSVLKNIEIIETKFIQGALYKEPIIEQSLNVIKNKLFLWLDLRTLNKLEEIPSHAKFNKEEFLNKIWENVIFWIEPWTIDKRNCDTCDGHGEIDCLKCFWKWELDCPHCFWKWSIEKIEQKEEILGKRPCPSCKTDWFIKCPSCNWLWKKEVVCHSCQGKGKIELKEFCSFCKGSWKKVISNPSLSNNSFYNNNSLDYKNTLNQYNNLDLWNPSSYVEKAQLEEKIRQQQLDIKKQQEQLRAQQYLNVNQSSFSACDYCEGVWYKIKEIPCKSCKGVGKLQTPCIHCNQKGTIRCKTCEGKGFIENKQKKQIILAEDCRFCKGVWTFICKDCNGTWKKTCKDCRGERTVTYATINKFTLLVKEKNHIILPKGYEIISDLSNNTDFFKTKDLIEDIYNGIINLQNSLGKIYNEKVKIFKGTYVKYKVWEEKFNLFVNNTGVFYDYLPWSFIEGKNIFNFKNKISWFFENVSKKIKKSFEKNEY